MAQPTPDWDPSIVLAHDRFLRALAHSLIADAQSADDLAQQAWLRALEHRPSGASFHAWLRTTLDRLAATWRRTNARRLTRERAASRPEVVPSHEDLCEGEAVRRAVVDAVLRLAEPYRSTVALRFFDGLPPRAIARRMGAPVETVRTRLKTALKQLRAILDREHGDRRAWCLALVPLAQTVPVAAMPAFLTGVLAMTIKTKVLATAILCAALSLLIWIGSGPDAATPDRASDETATVAVQADAITDSPAARVPIPTVSSTAAQAPTTGSLIVHLRWRDGTVAEDVGVRVLPALSDVLGYGERDARTDAAGAARFADLSPGAILVQVDRATAKPKATIEAGREAEITLAVGAAANVPPFERERRVEGSVVTPDGGPVAGAEILLSSSWRRPLVAAHSAADGTFVLRDVEPMFVIEARAAGFAPSARSCDLFHLMMREDPKQLVRMRLVLGPMSGRVRGLVRDPRGMAIAGAVVQIGRDFGGRVVEDIKLADGATAASPNPARARTDAAGGFACGSIPAGSNDVVVRAPGFGAWTGQVDVTMGRESTLTIDLVPGVTVRGKAADAKGTALDGVLVGVGHRGFLAATQTATRADGTYELRDLTAGEIVVFAMRLNTVTETKLFGNAGEVLTWDPVFDVGQELRGRVVDERGEPVVGAEISARAAPRLSAHARTDQRGVFAIANWRDVPTEVTVKAKGTGWLPCARFEGAGPGPEIVITVREADIPSAFVKGVLLGSDGGPSRTAVLSASNAKYPMVSNRGAQPTNPDRQTGAFEIGPLPAGTWNLEVRSAGDAWHFVTVADLAARETRDLGTLRLQRPAILDVTAKRGDGAPLAEVTWPITNEHGEYAGWISMRDGTAHHEKLATGTYFVQARGEGVAHSMHRISVVSDERTRLDVTQVATSPVAFEFVPPPGDACIGLRVQVRDANGASVVDEQLWRFVGTVPFVGSLGLLAGTYRLDARTDSGSLVTRALKIGTAMAAQPLRLELR